MKSDYIFSIIQKLRSEIPGKLVEDHNFYSGKATQHNDKLVQACSDGVSGELLQHSISGKGNVIIRGKNSSSSKSSLLINGDNNIIFLGPHSRLNNSSIRITCSNSIFYFGAFSTVESMTALLSGNDGKIEIGDFCMLSARIIIDRSDHHSIYDLSTGHKINEDRDVEISDHVWISRDVRVSKGSVIGKNSIIGQASLVTGTLKSSCAYGGVPAKCLREGVTWSRMKSNSIEEMENSDRHKSFLLSVEDIKNRMELSPSL